MIEMKIPLEELLGGRACLVVDNSFRGIITRAFVNPDGRSFELSFLHEGTPTTSIHYGCELQLVEEEPTFGFQVSKKQEKKT